METWEHTLSQLREQFLRGTGERLSRIAGCLDRLERDPADRAALLALRHEFHGLSGVGTTYGFPQVTSLGLEGEASCDALLPHGPAPAPREVEAWRCLLEKLRAQFARAEPGPAPEASAPDASVKPPDVLVVDDDAEFLRMASAFAEKDGFSVRAAETYAEAAAEIGRQIPDAALVDVGLPDGSGYELVERLRAKPGGENVAVLIVTGRTGFLDRVEAIHCGADGFFQKPVEWGAVSRKLQQLLGRTRAEAPRILYVEDDPEQAAYARAILESAGYEVSIVSDPKQFEATLTAFRPELVLMDILLPGVSGYDLVRYLRQDERYAALPVLFLTTQHQLQVRIQAVKAGGDEHLVKPIAPGLLLSTVAARIERARFVRDLLERDGLTRLLTHTAFLERARVVIARTRRRAQEAPAPVLAMLDLDHFKAVNDRYGHPAGDRVLASLASLLRQRLRQTDVIGRMGGEEFGVILEDLTVQDAVRLIERLLRSFSELEHRDPEGATFHATFSAGVAALDPGSTDVNRWLEAADAALYSAKAAGRNRVAHA